MTSTNPKNNSDSTFFELHGETHAEAAMRADSLDSNSQDEKLCEHRVAGNYYPCPFCPTENNNSQIGNEDGS